MRLCWAWLEHEADFSSLDREEFELATQGEIDGDDVKGLLDGPMGWDLGDGLKIPGMTDAGNKAIVAELSLIHI
eukprot:10274159-Alexandrium_andersonii.AAC.1